MSYSALKNVPLPIRIGFVLALLAFSLIATFLYVNRPKPKALTDKDTILLTEFDNKTGDAVFDGTLRQGLAVQLQQSPFLSLFPDTRVRETLKLMGRTGDERLTREIGREIARRQGLKALIAGTIVSLGRNYSLTLEALNSQTGETIGLTQAEAEGKEDVLKALSQVAAQMREKLGESLGSIRRFDKPLEFTISSLDALKAFAVGNEQASQGKVFEAIRFYRHAVELAPDFAIARSMLASFYAQTNQPELAAENARQAFALKDRLSDRERIGVSLAYYTFVTGELDKRLEALELYQRTYPQHTELKLALASTYVQIGQFAQAVATLRESLRLDANGAYAATAYMYLKDPLLRLNEFAEAKAIGERALQQQLDATDIHASLYQIAFVNGDTAAMQRAA
jgi:Flp pilus assembly protein TadD